MSYRKHSAVELRWYKAGYLTIAKKLEKEIKKSYNELGQPKLGAPEQRRSFYKLRWRLGYNQYKAGRCKEAVFNLLFVANTLQEQEAKSSQSGKKQIDHEITDTSHIHQVIGLAAMYLFLESYEHSHLDISYQHYQFAVDHIQANLVAMFKLPTLLLEYGRILEYYGSFETAMDIYGQVLTKFPNFHGYFTALYRTAIVGRHLASLTTDPEEKQNTLDKCIDILHFLLEALPSNVNQVHIVFLYARSLELSTDAGTRYRAYTIYKSLHKLCQKHSLALSLTIKESKEWSNDPKVWWELAKYFDSYNEFIIARDAYQKYLELMKKTVKAGKDLSTVLSVEQCVTLATNYAKYQSYNEAVKFAEYGLANDKYNLSIRNLLGKWNTNYSSSFTKEIDAVRMITRVWRYRCWSLGYMKRLRDNMINELESTLKKNYFDFKARERLAYYAKKQYRHQFIYEEECTRKIQNWFRIIKKYMVWTEAQRLRYDTLATEIMEEMQRKRQYYHIVTRLQIISFAKKKLMTRNHPLRVTAKRMILENRSFAVLFRILRIFHFRRVVAKRIEERINYRNNKILENVMKLQCFIRVCNAKSCRIRAIRERKRLEAAATRIQRFIRSTQHSFRYIVVLVMYKEYRRRIKAMKILKKKLPYYMRQMKARRQSQLREMERRTRKRRDKLKRVEQNSNLVMAAMKIQQCYLRYYYTKQFRRYASMWRPRKKAIYNPSYAQLIEKFVTNPKYKYANPGIDRQSAAFEHMLASPIVVCTKDMSPSDYLLLGNILKHPQSNVSTLVLYETVFMYHINEEVINHYAESMRKKQEVHTNPIGQPYSSEEKSMISFFYALMKSISIRSIFIIGGRYYPNILGQLFKLIQLDNARIEEVVINSVQIFTTSHVPKKSMLAHLLVSSASQLLMDYFNYTLQGIKKLCLHNVRMADEEVETLCEGLRINPSLQSLHLSCNLITDRGFVSLFQALLAFPTTHVSYVDLSCNLIALKRKDSHQMIREYRKEQHPYLLGKNLTLTYNLMHNLILQKIDIVEISLEQHIIPQLDILYEEVNHSSAAQHSAKTKKAIFSHSNGMDRVLHRKIKQMHRTSKLPLIAIAKEGGWTSSTGGEGKVSASISLPHIGSAEKSPKKRRGKEQKEQWWSRSTSDI